MFPVLEDKTEYTQISDTASGQRRKQAKPHGNAQTNRQRATQKAS